MYRCTSCGFDGAEEGKPCPSCGAAERQASEQRTMDSPFQGIAHASIESTSSVYPVGHLYDNRYKVKEFLGRGGMGSVYRVFDQELKMELALKTLHSEMEEDGAGRFKRKIEILSRIRHESVPRIYGWGKVGTEMYFVAEFIDGRDLKTEMKKRGPWTPEEAAGLIATIADCLAAAHSKGVIHRDVKPHNIMLTKANAVRILDFGVARAKGQDMATLTRTGMIVGTPEYMSPEQFSGRNVDERTDIYSLGVLLYELLTGQLPFDGPTPVAIAMAHMQQAVLPPSRVRKDVPDWLDRIICKCLEKDMTQRYESATELAAALRNQQAGIKPKTRYIPGGDNIVRDDSENATWGLIVMSPNEKITWNLGMAMSYEEKLYKLEEMISPSGKGQRWRYHFSVWPTRETVRRILDYEVDRTQQPVFTEKKSFWQKVFGRE